MPTTLTKKAVEKSTYIVQASFKDEDENPVTPDSLQWTLSDEFGSAIVSASPAGTTPIDIILSGDDLALADTDHPIRLLTVEGTYSSAAAAGLPFKDYARFEIDPIRAVT